MSVLRDSCILYTRAVLVLLNVLIYCTIFSLFSDMSEKPGVTDTIAAYQNFVTIVRNKDARQSLESRVVVAKTKTSFEDAIQLAYFGQGYQQAQEDLWGLHKIRKTAMANDFSSPSIAEQFDLTIISYYSEATIGASIRNRLQAFADGINAYKNSLELLPLEFYTSGQQGEFADWQVYDTICVLKYLEFRMSEAALEAKLLRYDLLRSGLHPKMVDQIAPPHGLVGLLDKPFAFKLSDSVIGEEASSEWGFSRLSAELVSRQDAEKERRLWKSEPVMKEELGDVIQDWKAHNRVVAEHGLTEQEWSQELQDRKVVERNQQPEDPENREDQDSVGEEDWGDAYDEDVLSDSDTDPEWPDNEETAPGEITVDEDLPDDPTEDLFDQDGLLDDLFTPEEDNQTDDQLEATSDDELFVPEDANLIERHDFEEYPDEWLLVDEYPPDANADADESLTQDEDHDFFEDDRIEGGQEEFQDNQYLREGHTDLLSPDEDFKATDESLSTDHLVPIDTGHLEHDQLAPFNEQDQIEELLSDPTATEIYEDHQDHDSSADHEASDRVSGQDNELQPSSIEPATAPDSSSLEVVEKSRYQQQLERQQSRIQKQKERQQATSTLPGSEHHRQQAQKEMPEHLRQDQGGVAEEVAADREQQQLSAQEKAKLRQKERTQRLREEKGKHWAQRQQEPSRGTKKAKRDVPLYDAHGFDGEGFDRYGFDAQGFDRNGLDYNGFTRDQVVQFISEQEAERLVREQEEETLRRESEQRMAAKQERERLKDLEREKMQEEALRLLEELSFEEVEPVTEPDQIDGMIVEDLGEGEPNLDNADEGILRDNFGIYTHEAQMREHQREPEPANQSAQSRQPAPRHPRKPRDRRSQEDQRPSSDSHMPEQMSGERRNQHPEARYPKAPLSNAEEEAERVRMRRLDRPRQQDELRQQRRRQVEEEARVNQERERMRFQEDERRRMVEMESRIRLDMEERVRSQRESIKMLTPDDLFADEEVGDSAPHSSDGMEIPDAILSTDYQPEPPAEGETSQSDLATQHMHGATTSEQLGETGDVAKLSNFDESLNSLEDEHFEEADFDQLGLDNYLKDEQGTEDEQEEPGQGVISEAQTDLEEDFSFENLVYLNPRVTEDAPVENVQQGEENVRPSIEIDQEDGADTLEQETSPGLVDPQTDQEESQGQLAALADAGASDKGEVTWDASEIARLELEEIELLKEIQKEERLAEANRMQEENRQAQMLMEAEQRRIEAMQQEEKLRMEQQVAEAELAAQKEMERKAFEAERLRLEEEERTLLIELAAEQARIEAEQERLQAEALERARLEAFEKRMQEARAAEEARFAAEVRASEELQKKEEETAAAEKARLEEEERQLLEQLAAEVARIEAEAKAEKARLAEEARLAEQARLEEMARQEELARIAEETRRRREAEEAAMREQREREREVREREEKERREIEERKRRIEMLKSKLEEKKQESGATQAPSAASPVEKREAASEKSSEVVRQETGLDEDDEKPSVSMEEALKARERMRQELEERRRHDLNVVKEKQKEKSQEIIEQQNKRHRSTKDNRQQRLREEREAKLETEKERRKSRIGQPVASTSWAIHGSHTASGSALLVVEPHTAPHDEVKYVLTQIELFGQTMTGSTFLGVPGLFNGRTAKVAWGQTSANLMDNILLYREHLNPEKTHYAVDGKWLELNFGPCPYTARGQVIEYKGEHFSLKWAGNDNAVLDSYFDLQDALMNAKNWDDFLAQAYLSDYKSMPVNLVTAFSDGKIGYNLVASVYKESVGNQILDGTQPVRLIEQSVTQQRLSNPPNGFIVAANNQATVQARPVPGTTRSMQLNLRLGSLTGGSYQKLQLEDMEKVLLGDVTDPFAVTLLKQLKLTSCFHQQINAFKKPEAEKINFMSGILHDWDAQFKPGSIHATVFTLYISNAVRILFSDIGDESVIDRLLDTDEFLDGFLKVVDTVIRMPYQNHFNEILCQSGVTSLGKTHKANCAFLLTYALVQTYDQLLEFVGGEGVANQVLERPQIPTWAELTGWEFGGNKNTPRYTGVSQDGQFRVEKLAAYRQVVDLGAPEGLYSSAEWKNSALTSI